MSEPESAPAAPPAAETPAKKKRQQPKKAGAAKKSGSKPSGPTVSELLLKAVSASKERSGVSFAALKKALCAANYDVEKKNSHVKLALKALVTKGSLVQVKGTGASGSFKINKKQANQADKKKATKKPAAKSPKKPKKAPSAAKSPKKAPAKKPAAAKKPKAAAAAKPKKAAKSPAKKAAKPKAAKSPAKKAVKSPAKKVAKPKKAAPKKKLGVTLGLLGQQHGLDVGQDAALSDSDPTEQLVELLVVAHCQLQVSRDDAGLLVVPGSVAGQLENLSSQVLEHGSQVDGSSGAHPLGIVALPEQTVDTANGKLETGPGGAKRGPPHIHKTEPENVHSTVPAHGTDLISSKNNGEERYGVSKRDYTALCRKGWVALKRTVDFVLWGKKEQAGALASEAVESASLSLESIDDIHGGDCLALGVLGVGDSVADHILQEDFEHPTGLLVDEARDALDTPSPSQAADGGLSDALDVITQHLPVPLGASFPQTLPAFSSSRHVKCCCCCFFSLSRVLKPFGSLSLYTAEADLREDCTKNGRGFRARCALCSNKAVRGHRTRSKHLHRLSEHCSSPHSSETMSEPECAPAAPPAAETPAKKKRQQPKKVGAAKKSGSKPSGPTVSELLLKAVSASKERSGVSFAALKKALCAANYDVEKKNSHVKLALKALVTKGSLVQVKGTGASGSFKINKKQANQADKKKATKKPAAKSPKKPKKAPSAAKSPKKAPAKKPAAAKKPKAAAAAKPKKAAKSPAKKAAKPKAAKSPAKKAVKSPAKKSPAKKAAKPKAAKSPAKKAVKSPAKKVAKPKKAAPKKK
ncbi:uncharacterized protein PAF06_009923 [Gastrophryne carolinensis]